MADLGYKPLTGKLLLSDGADWVCNLSISDFDAEGNITTVRSWPEGTLVWAEVGDLPKWDAIVTATTGTASFVVQSDTTDPVEDGTEYSIFVQYPGTPTTEYAWFEDVVQRTRA